MTRVLTADDIYTGSNESTGT